ncbi:uncharacterized protein P174DRAFT_218240 [Aspergillus novofumigatus IBT 16806]|uniref:Uncharacterized protein n=1 Tax=Aspergillus novofumigatus (strain IBT 16806) TaxID=1392255 RepID=A0A2I1C5X2_ASPN1|nr:uncharacterized protein P174DRAFT_218240 [Aspergillus novofumigatus IBT 16806]PKX93014.1 hypothetical protein P174DRAFT_218240 [Aspergillus novofumigatus IBT 16806]
MQQWGDISGPFITILKCFDPCKYQQCMEPETPTTPEKVSWWAAGITEEIIHPSDTRAPESPDSLLHLRQIGTLREIPAPMAACMHGCHESLALHNLAIRKCSLTPASLACECMYRAATVPCRCSFFLRPCCWNRPETSDASASFTFLHSGYRALTGGYLRYTEYHGSAAVKPRHSDPSIFTKHNTPDHRDRLRLLVIRLTSTPSSRFSLMKRRRWACRTKHTAKRLPVWKVTIPQVLPDTRADGNIRAFGTFALGSVPETVTSQFLLLCWASKAAQTETREGTPYISGLTLQVICRALKRND